MSDINNKLELLSPAGDIQALKAAVNNGADSVYVGLTDGFSARAKAGNFSLEQLKEACDFAHLFGVRVYAAVNTLLKPSEIKVAADLIEAAAKAGTDAFILQDLGLLYELQKSGLNLEYHLSTQGGVHNAPGAAAAEKMGFSRVILSRETSLDDIKAIKKATNIDLEFFVHGALCVSFSGNCYFSSLITGESGNRGRCLQFCRKSYKLIDEKNTVLKSGYCLSAKDLNLSDEIKRLADAGITSFKIEGRLRRAEYAGETARVYRSALDGGDKKVSGADLNRLKTMFNRGDYCKGYLCGDKAIEIIYPYCPSHIGVKIGKVKEIYALPNGKKTALIEYDGDLGPVLSGDGIKFMRNGLETGSALIADTHSITFSGNVTAGDSVNLTSSKKMNDGILKKRREIHLSVNVDITTGKNASITLSDKILTVTAYSFGTVQESLNAPLSVEKLKNILVTADENIAMSHITLNLGQNCFIPMSELKDMRRRAVSEYITKKLSEYKKRTPSTLKAGSVKEYFEGLNYLSLNGKRIFVAVNSAAAVSEKLLSLCDYVILNPMDYGKKTLGAFIDRVGKERAVLNLPSIAKGGDLDILGDIAAGGGFENVIVNNIYALEMFRDKHIILGAKMNLLNDVYLPDGCAYIASYEAEKPKRNAINYIYGYVPLMTLAHCPKKNFLNADCKACAQKDGDIALTDERGAVFPYRRYKVSNCYYELLNSLPLDNREVLAYNDCSVLIDLSNEAAKADKILEGILNDKHSGNAHTHGNYKRKLV